MATNDSFKSFDEKYSSNIVGLAKANNVTADTAKAMLISNLTQGGQYKGGGTLDFNAAKSDYENAKNGVTSSGGSGGYSYPGSSSASSTENPYIRQIYESQKGAEAAAIRAARDKAISGYQQQIEQAPQTYQPLRNQASVGGAKQLQAVKELMASQGLQNSGDNLTAQVAVNSATENNINNYSAQEQNLINSLNRAIGDANNSASLEEIKSNSALNSQMMQALLSDSYRQQDRQDRLTQQDFDNRATMSQITGYFNPFSSSSVDSSLLKYSDNFQAEIDRRKAINPNDPTIPALESLRVGKMFSNPELLSQYGGSYKTMAARQADKNFDYQVSRDKILDDRWMMQFNSEERQRAIDNALKSRQISISEYESLTGRNRLGWEMSPNNPDNMYKMAQIDNLKNSNKNFENDPDFKSDYNSVIQNSDTAYDEVVKNSQQLIARYGVDGFNKLLSAAKSSKENYWYSP